MNERAAAFLVAPIAAVTACVLAGPPPAAQATLPGEPGPLVFQRFIDPRDDASAQIFSVGPAGGRPTQLTDLRGGAFAPEVSPDGLRIAFERYSTASPRVFVMGADGSGLVRATSGCVRPRCLGDDGPSWMPGGDLLFSRGFGPARNDFAAEIDLMRAGGEGQQVLRRFLKSRDGREAHHDAQPSPDGGRLAITVVNSARKPKLGSAIYVLDADGGDLRRVTPTRLNAGNPDWSPDGKRIVFNSSYEGQSAVEIYTVRPDGSRLRRVRREPEESYSFEPVWSPDGGRIAVVHGTFDTVPHIWTMKRDGTGLRQLTRGRKPDFRVDWGVGPPA